MRKTIVSAAHHHDLFVTVVLAALPTASLDLCAQKSEEEIALAARNPVAAMVGLPLQYNYDQKIWPQDDGDKNCLNAQPVIPFSLNQGWNLI